MNRDDIIRMAGEAGFEKYEKSSLSGKSALDQTLQVGEYPVGEAVFKFAALVAAAERERFAAECIDLVAMYGGPVDLEAAIRARGETK